MKRRNKVPKTQLGQLFFSVMSHSLYDLGLYRFVSPYIWRCPTARLLDNYVDNISANHLEVGVGSGYFLQRTLCADFVERLALVDLNRRCLHKSARRLRTFTPQLDHHDILDPFASAESSQETFSSVGMNYVLHCISGGFLRNQRIFRHVHSMLDVNGVFFGATLIQQPLARGVVSWGFMKLLNAVGIFHNERHTVAELRQALATHFCDVQIAMVGHAAIFRARK